MKRQKIIAVDLDGTLTKKGFFPDFMDLTPNQLKETFDNAEPDKEMIKIINDYVEKGYLVYVFTSRQDIHQNQVSKWLKKHKINVNFFIMNKPYYDLLIDDKAISPEQIKELHKIEKHQKV